MKRTMTYSHVSKQRYLEDQGILKQKGSGSQIHQYTQFRINNLLMRQMQYGPQPNFAQC